MITFKVKFNDSFQKKLNAVNKMTELSSTKVVAGFPAEKVDQLTIYVARAINYRHNPRHRAELPVNWHPRRAQPHRGIPTPLAPEGKLIPLTAYRSWAFMNAASEQIAALNFSEFLRRYFSALLLNRKGVNPMMRLGERMTEIIRGCLLKASAAAGYPLTLAWSTVLRKKRKQVLIESGEMMGAITYVLRPAGEVGVGVDVSKAP